MAISDKTIESIKSRISIVDVVSRYVQVTTRSGTPWVKCPFHGGGNERTPSMKLSLERGSYYCFGCQKRGSMFNFVMEMEKVSFPESVKILGEWAGVQVEDETPQGAKKREEKDNLLVLNELMASTFHRILMTDPAAEAARAYLEKRKITRETILRFRLGYAPKGRDWLYDFIKGEGYSDDFLRESGFFSKNSYPYPLFSDRLIFPVKNWQGKVVAFGGRDLSFREGAPKYLNTPETSVYSKKHNLFALYEGLEEIRRAKEAIVCEGNFDAISLHQAGIPIAVAPFGTAFTSEQASLLGRYCDKVKLLFDTDTAGQEATRKAAVMLQEKGIESEVLFLDKHKDASEYLEEEGPEALGRTLSKGVDSFQHLVTCAGNNYNISSPKGKSEAVQFLAPFINATQSGVEKEAYTRQVAEFLGVGEEQVAADMRPRGRNQAEAPATQGADTWTAAPLKTGSISPDLYMMLVFANHRDLFAKYTKAFRFGDLKDKEAQLIYLALENYRRDGVGKTDEIFLSLIADEQVRHDVAVSFELEEFNAADPEKVIDEILDRIAMRKLEDHRKMIVRQIRQGEAEGLGDEDLRELLNEKVSVDREIGKLKARLGGQKG